MKLTRFLSVALCVLMLVTLFAACSDDTDNEESKSPVSTDGSTSSQADDNESSTAGELSEASSTETSEEDKYRDDDGIYAAKHLPDFKDEWKDYGEFRVLVYSDHTQKTYYSEEIEPLYETTDQAIIDGVNTRNSWIENTYGIKIKAVPVPNVIDAIRTEISGGGDTFDAAMPFMPACATLAQEGSLLDLTEFSDYIDLDAPWWDQNATQAMSVGDKVFFTAGDMTIMQKIVASAIAFNKDMLANNFGDFNIYQSVRDGTWTLDTLYSMCKQVTTSLNDDDVMDENDQWGILDTGPSFFYGCGEQLIAKDSDNYPTLSLGETDRSISVAQKVLNYSNEKKTWMATVADFTDRTNIYNTIVQVFGEGRSLFMALHFSAVKKLRPYDVNYGLVPAAKYNEEQESYFTKCSAAYAYGVCLPLTVKDAEYSAYMCELMSVGGKNYVANTYYNVVLKGKDIDDEDSEYMLDLVFDGIVYDPAVVYGFKGLDTIISSLIAKNSSDIVSELTGMKGAIETAIDDVILAYED